MVDILNKKEKHIPQIKYLEKEPLDAGCQIFHNLKVRFWSHTLLKPGKDGNAQLTIRFIAIR